MTAHKRYKVNYFLVPFLLALLLGVNAYLINLEPKIPTIQGVVIPDGKTIDDFALISHENTAFTERDLLGRWHILAYGYTDCPDICPTTLNTLAQVSKRLTQYKDVRMLFYTIDPQRDTVEHIAKYIAYFGEAFVALTSKQDKGETHLPFERSLGMVSELVPLPENEAEHDYKGYRVSHGVVLYVLNPKGHLQAILKPARALNDTQVFHGDVIYRDFIAIRNFFD